jgi:hypothetical protein
MTEVSSATPYKNYKPNLNYAIARPPQYCDFGALYWQGKCKLSGKKMQLSFMNLCFPGRLFPEIISSLFHMLESYS